MFSLVYVSTSVKLFSDTELEGILQESRAWNKDFGITGLLLYKEGNFMQFLEGPKETVLKLLGRIKTDPRHHSMIIINQQENAQRHFESWSMGFERIPSGREEAPAGFTDLWELPFSSDEFLSDPTRCLKFLMSFRHQVH
jgi:hypothetical protein